MEVKYNLTKQDYIDFNIYHVKNSNTIKKSLLIQRYAIPLIFIISIFLFTILTDIPFLYLFTIFFIVSVLWIAFYPKYFVSDAMKRISKMLDESSNKDLLGKHNTIINEEGLTEKSENGENKINWNGVLRIVSTENHFFIYISSISAFIVPKRSFNSQSDQKTFYNFVKSMIDNK